MRRLRYPEISRLPKSSKYTAVQWRNQTPGSLEPFFTSQIYKPDLLVDPNHPAATIRKVYLPSIKRDDVGIRMMPLGLLLREEKQFPAIPVLSWRERVEIVKEAGVTSCDLRNHLELKNTAFKPGEQLYPKYDYNNFILPSQKITPRSQVLDLMLKKTWRRVPMSFHVSTSKARMGQFRHQRKHIEKRLRAAINLIVSRGAHFDRKTGKIGINMDDSGRQWVMQGWAYMFFPTTQIHQMPYTELIDLLRTLLTNVNKRALDLENKWLYDSLSREENSAREKSIGRPHAGRSPSTSNQKNKDAPVHPDLITKMRLVELQKTRAKKADLAATSNVSQASSSAITRSNNGPQMKDGSQKETQKASSDLTAEGLSPSKVLAGKAPVQWKKEMISSLSMLVDSPSLIPKLTGSNIESLL